MVALRRKFSREPASQRRDALIRATLALIAENGLGTTTVRSIAEQADVTQGLIRHYFSTKEELITAAYEWHMVKMSNATFASAQTAGQSPVARLAAFVTTGLRPPIADPDTVSLWAGFLTRVRNDEKMRAIHERTYRAFRDRLQDLIADTLAACGQHPDQKRLRRLAIACNAVIDGLWLEGGALPGAFENDELAEIGLASVSAIIGVNLESEAGQG